MGGRDEGVITLNIIIVIIIAIVLCIAVAIASFSYVLRAFNSIDAVLDRVLAKDASLRSEVTNEDRISKLIHKANRIMDMHVSEAVQASQEKEIIQGFISDMSHQMKTPLSGISMYADLLIEGNTTKEEQQEFLSRIKSGTDNLEWLMNCLIKMSRLEVGAVQLAPVCQNIRQTVTNAIGNVYAAASKKSIDIVTDDLDDISLLHDRRWTLEAITNILENAVKYSGEEGKIHVSVLPMSMHTKITITDYGIGIDKSEWNLIFKRFYRGACAKAADGAGLGLYLATIIMEKQGGYIMVDSVPEKHTTFSLFFQNCLS